MFKRRRNKPVISKKMKLFHGTTVDFDEIDFGFCQIPADFGRGFYMTDDFEKAKLRAKEKAEWLGLNHYYVIEYEFLDNLARVSRKVLELKRGPRWVSFIIDCRFYDQCESSDDVIGETHYDHGYSIVIGPSADGDNPDIIAKDYGGRVLTDDDYSRVDELLGDEPYGTQYVICDERDSRILIRKVCVHRFWIGGR